MNCQKDNKMNWINKIKRMFVAAMLCASFAIPTNTGDVNAATSQQVQEAAKSAKQELSGSRFVIDVENPYSESTPSAFPNGKEGVFVDIEAIKSDGTFLRNEPLTIEKPLSINIEGPTDTDEGSFKWKITSKSPIRANIRVKLARYPNVNRSFTVNFRPNYRITDKTDRQQFIYGQTSFFTAQISPSMVPGIKEAKLVYVYTRTYNKWGVWRTRQEQVQKDLKCSSDGLCVAKVNDDHTYQKRNERGTFRYRFVFKDDQGHRFSKSGRGTLQCP